MNPLLSFWIKAQPLYGSFGCHSWKAISQSSALASSSGDDAVVQSTTTSSSWAFDHIANAAASFASRVLLASSSWMLNPVISRMHDAPIFIKPSLSNKAICEADQRFTTRRVGAGVDAKRFTKSSSANKQEISPLQQSQQILQKQDYTNYQIKPPSLVRRNSKEWVREYKKERIDKINYNNVFGGISATANNELPILPPPAAEGTFLQDRSEVVNSKYLIPDSPTSTATVADSVTSLPSLSSHPISPKSMNAAPSSYDVICGRGGKANTHQGNISFREEARKLRSWYESSSKSEKFTISSYLVDLVRERGGRFLKRDKDAPGTWQEADSNDVRKKASQALREGRMKEKNK